MSIHSESDLKWKKLVSFPFTSPSQPFAADNDEFIVATSKTPHSNEDGIYKFNTHKNEWIKIFDYDKNANCYIHSVAYDNTHKLLYACAKSRHPLKMLTFDLQTENKVTSKKEQNGGYFGLIFVEDKLHKICTRNGDHYIYDKTKKFQKITTFKSLKELIYYNFIYLR
eukprot:454552_1